MATDPLTSGAPAVALGALYCDAVFGGDATMLVLPADHLIRDSDAFAAAVLSREGGYAKGLGMSCEEAIEGVENTHERGKAIGSATKIL